MKKKVAAALAAVGAVFLIGTTVHASANQTYTNRSEFVNVYKYGKLRHGRHTMMRYRYFKRIGHMHVGNRVRFNGSNFLFLPKLGGYVPEYQLKLVKPVKKVKKAKKVVKKSTKKKKTTKHAKKMIVKDTSASDLSLSNRMFDDSFVVKHEEARHHDFNSQNGSNAAQNSNVATSNNSSSLNNDVNVASNNN
ncbi:hypothetical protein AKUA2003_14230 [Apilactobacillus kunkeei]|nr:hypothetical protein AKUA2003_14230 [Apilactobacillus kunkeei]CAI2667290.1 hypothetical protein AKUA1001_14260 [Apilactobacillus kunkeei]CAI2803540.1 hypothetical protein AKUA2002_14250 [Apilactobacillus kunkeei]